MSFEARVQQILRFYQERRRMPSFSEIAAMTGLHSKNAVPKLVRKMIMRELIAQDAQGRLIPARRWREVPFVGLVEAGFPSPADEQLLETLSLEEWLIRNREATYLLKVRGDSMIDAGILDGDLVVVDRGLEPKPGDVVVAVCHGEMTLKRLHIARNGRAALRAENPDFPEFVVCEEMPAEIWGVVVGVVRKLR